MKKNRPWKEQMVSALELPADLAYSEPIVTLTGTTEALIENYKCILVYTESEIVILTLRGKVSICGKNLESPVVYPTGNEDNRNDFFCFSAETVGIEIWEKSFAVYPVKCYHSGEGKSAGTFFKNLCRSRNISMEHIRRKEGQITARIKIRDFFRLRPVRNKTGVHIQVTEKQGMPFFFLRSKKRKAFFAGFSLGLVLLFFLSGRIWNIHIQGNVQNSKPEILEFLESRESVMEWRKHL